MQVAEVKSLKYTLSLFTLLLADAVIGGIERMGIL